MKPRLERWVPLLLALATFVLLLVTEKPIGFTRDESVYFDAAESYARWYRLLANEPSRALGDDAIVQAFGNNHEHPVLMKTLFGLSELVFSEWLHWVRPATGFRIPAFAFAALIPALLYAWGQRLGSRAAGVFAALAFFAVPRQFFHAHLACFDMPIAAMWLAVAFAFVKGQTSRRWALGCGALFGLALATKHNAFFLPVLLLPFGAVRAWKLAPSDGLARGRLFELGGGILGWGTLAGVLFGVEGPVKFVHHFGLLSPMTALIVLGLAGLLWQWRRLRAASTESAQALLPLVAIGVLGPLVLYAHWPYLWHHPIERVAWYLQFHATHNHYAWMYLGTLLREPPFPLAYVWVVTAMTVPLTLFLPMLLGLFGVGVEAWRRRVWPSWELLFVVANALASITLISLPDVPHFGGVKHWFPSMPFLALLSGLAVVRAARAVAASWPRIQEPVAAVVLGALLLLPAVLDTAHGHPWGTPFYAELAGGLPGAASLGMQRQFWSNNITGVLPWINEHAPPNARLWLHEVNGFSFRDYQRNGMLRNDLRPAGGPEDADLAAYQYHQEFREQELAIWNAFATTQPVTGLYLDETPQIVVYARP